jgi:predicted transport protein
MREILVGQQASEREAPEVIMSMVDQGLQSQIENIEAKYGRPINDWVELIRASGHIRHGEIVAMLKGDYGLSHGAANRVALVAMDALAPKAETTDPEAMLYAGNKAALLPIHERLMGSVLALGREVEVAPKKGYLSLRRRKQFAMIRPAARHVDLGLVLTGRPVDARFESAANFNALFTHRVRVRSVEDVDPELVRWLEAAYEAAR